MSSTSIEPIQRTLKRDTSILVEFNNSLDPNCLILYYHIKDCQFDAFNASEYHQQLMKCFENNMEMKEVVSRSIQGMDYLLICLMDRVLERNSLCELAFLCQRQFQGMTMLVKRKCFNCNKPTNKQCSVCKISCFCSQECQKKGWSYHKSVCNHIKKKCIPSVVDESEKLELIC